MHDLIVEVVRDFSQKGRSADVLELGEAMVFDSYRKNWFCCSCPSQHRTCASATLQTGSNWWALEAGRNLSVCFASNKMCPALSTDADKIRVFSERDGRDTPEKDHRHTLMHTKKQYNWLCMRRPEKLEVL